MPRLLMFLLSCIASGIMPEYYGAVLLAGGDVGDCVLLVSLSPYYQSLVHSTLHRVSGQNN